MLSFAVGAAGEKPTALGTSAPPTVGFASLSSRPASSELTSLVQQGGSKPGFTFDSGSNTAVTCSTATTGTFGSSALFTFGGSNASVPAGGGGGKTSVQAPDQNLKPPGTGKPPMQKKTVFTMLTLHGGKKDPEPHPSLTWHMTAISPPAPATVASTLPGLAASATSTAAVFGTGASHMMKAAGSIPTSSTAGRKPTRHDASMYPVAEAVL